MEISELKKNSNQNLKLIGWTEKQKREKSQCTWMHKINKPKFGGFKRSLKYQSQKRAMPKNVQTTPQLDSFHMLAR